MRKRYARVLCVGSFLLSSFIHLHGDNPVSFQSSESQVQVLELFTSQGCSSCPPAERWLNQLVTDPGLWTEIIPLVFHVDYWDRLGWKDPFANRQNTSRQYQYSKSGDIQNVYTPCFVSNGKEWRGWFSKQPLPTVEKTAGVLRGEMDHGHLEVFYSDKKNLTLNVAVLGFDLHTDVQRGENRGKYLEQQFVVLHHDTKQSSSGYWKLDLPDIDASLAERFGLAIWITENNKLKPLQATGTWLNKSNLD